MKCNRCGSFWHEVSHRPVCPFCKEEVRVSAEDVAALLDNAKALPDGEEEKKTAAFLAAAEYADPEALFLYATRVEKGKGVGKSPSRAAAYYLFAAEEGHAPSAFRLYEYCRRLRENEEESVFWLQVAAELGYPEGEAALGAYFEEKKQPTAAAYWYTRASDGGHFLSAYRLALMYRDGEGVPENPSCEKYYAYIADNGGVRQASRLLSRIDVHVFSEEPEPVLLPNRADEQFSLGYRAYKAERYRLAYLFYSMAAEAGNLRAENNLGVCFEKGHGIEKDEETAAYWYRRSAEKGYATAYLNLGDCYRSGIGVGVDGDAAFAAYLRAAELGSAAAQCLVGNCYYNADLVDRSVSCAAKWYEKAAMQGNKEALEKVNAIRNEMTSYYNCGVDAYKRGDLQSAVRFYTIAAELGHRGAACNLGYCYQKGLGCEQDARKAVAYYRRAAEEGSAPAELNLALCYLQGLGGLGYDYGEANRYLKRAIEHGSKEAEAVLAKNTAQKKKKLARKVYAIACRILASGDARLAEGLRFCRIAAEMGSGRALFTVGCHYEFGYGVERNESAAKEWYNAAFAAGYRNGSRIKSAILRRTRRPTGFRR